MQTSNNGKNKNNYIKKSSHNTVNQLCFNKKFFINKNIYSNKKTKKKENYYPK